MSTLVVEARERLQATPHRRRWPRVLGALCALWILSGIYLVQPDQQAVVTRFGAVVAPRVPSGLHYSLPWPVDRVYKLKVQQTRRLAIGSEIPMACLDAPSRRCPSTSAETRTSFMSILFVQYSVGEPALFLFRSQDAAQLLGAAVESEMSRRMARVNVDDILTTEKVAIQSDVRDAAQRDLEVYEAGVVLSSINIDSVTPPSDVAGAFRDVASARADAIRTVNDAQGYENDLLPRARGEAAQTLESAHGYGESKINMAQGDAARFVAVAVEYEKAPEVTRRRAYLEALEQILPRIKKLIVDPNGNFNLTIVRKAEAPQVKR